LFSLARVHPLTSIAWYVVCVATVYHPNLFFPVLQLTVVKHIVKQYMIRKAAQAQACTGASLHHVLDVDRAKVVVRGI
jgi:hypothetical protein